MIEILVLLWIVSVADSFNTFPSLITANASMAVVIAKSFFESKDDYHRALRLVPEVIGESIRKEMRLGGITVHLLVELNVTLSRDYTALLSIAPCHRTWLLHEMARKQEILHLAVTGRDCPRILRTVGISMPLIEPGRELAQIFLDLRMTGDFDWNNINVLHDDGFDRDTIGSVMRALTDEIPAEQLSLSSRSIFTIKHADSKWARKRNIKDLLVKYDMEQLANCFLVIVTMDIVTDVMEVARSLKLVHPGNQWLYVITDSLSQNSANITSFADLLAEGGNVAFLYNATEFDDICNSGLYCYVKEFSTMLANALEHSLLTEVELWDRVNEDEFEMIRLTKSERRREILKLMNFSLDKSAPRGHCGRCLLWQVSSAITWGNFFLHGKSIAHIVDSGFWTLGGGVNLTDVIFPHVSYGFRGASLPIVTYHNPPWQIIRYTQREKPIYDGLMFDVLKYLSKKLNFTYTVVTLVERDRGYWNITINAKEQELGMALPSTIRQIPPEVIDMVHNKKVLLAACAYTVNDYTGRSINFTIPIFVQTYSFITARPKQLSRVLLFTLPFTGETWACLAAAIIIMGPILYTVHKYSPCSTKTSGLNSSWQCIWYVYGALLQQGGMYLPRCDSARLLVGTWWLVVMVVVATYSGSLVAFLTFPKMDAAILTLDELLARKNRFTWGFPNGSFLEEYLLHSDDEKHRILLTRSERHNDTDVESMVKRVKNGKHVFIDWRSSLRFLMRKDLLTTGGCHFSLSTEEFMDEPIAMILSQDSPYLSIINAELHRMHESGLMNKWISEKLPGKDKCWEMLTNDQAVYKRKVNVADMQGIFFVLFMGVAIAIFLLCCEFYCHRRRVAKERKFIRPFVS